MQCEEIILHFKSADFPEIYPTQKTLQ